VSLRGKTAEDDHHWTTISQILRDIDNRSRKLQELEAFELLTKEIDKTNLTADSNK